MNASTLNPKSDPTADKRADQFVQTLKALYQLRRAVKLQNDVYNASLALERMIAKLDNCRLCERELICSTVQVVANCANGRIYKYERPLLLEVVGAVERQIELVAERAGE